MGLRPPPRVCETPAVSRLPNAPEVFVGRADERAWLAARIEARPLSIVWGPKGIGKTGLVLSVCRGIATRERAVYVSAREASDDDGFLADVASEIVRASGDDAAARGLGSRARRGRSRTEAIALVLELAERADVLVVVDDLDALSEDTADRLLLVLARFAERARVVVSTRIKPRHDDLADKTLRLERLSDDDVRRISLQCAPRSSPAEVDEIVRRAGGSPHRARLLSLGCDVDAGASLLVGLGEPARRAALAMSLVRVPVELAEPSRAELDARGLVTGTGGRVQLDDGLRAIVAAEHLDGDDTRRISLELLERTTGPAALFERVRIALDASDPGLRERARELLASGQRDLFVAGYATAIFGLLEKIADRSYDAFRFACAEWTQSGPALAWALVADPPEDLRARLARCKLLLHGGRVTRAVTEAEGLVADVARADPTLHDEAMLLLGDLERHRGQPERAVALFEALSPSDPYIRADRDLRLSAAYVATGEIDRAVAILDAHPEDTLGPDDRRRLVSTLGGALLYAGRFRELERVIGLVDPEPDARANELFSHLALAVERGAFELAERLLRRVRVYVEESAHLRFAHAYASIRMRLVVGPLDGLRETADALAHDPRVAEIGDLVAWSRGAKAAVDVVLAPGVLLEEPAGAFGEAARTVLDAWRAILAARRGEAAAIAEDSSRAADVQIVWRRARAEVLLARDDFDAASAVLDEAIDFAQRSGLVLDEITLVALAVDARLLAARRAGRADRAASDRAASSASALRERSEKLVAPRFADEARLASWILAAPDARDPATLLALAESVASPVARRRANAIAGRVAALDALDRKVVAAAREAPVEAAALILDLGAREIRLPSGRRVDVSSSELAMRLLEVLARAGGRASKEALVREGWQLSTYHPHRDDKRLQVAIHRVRHLLESAELIARDGDGYRVTIPLRIGSATP